MNALLKSFPWLQPGWAQLSHYIDQQRIPQALLITGTQGMAKRQLAECFAQSLMCSEVRDDGSFCGECHSCHLFSAGTHPDYFLLEADDDSQVIKIDSIRKLLAKLVLKPQFEAQRMVLIDPADAFNTSSANAFLKFLEEPSERTRFVLLTDKPYKLPATIRSRCQKIMLQAASHGQLQDWLQEQGIDNNVDLLLRLSKGSPLLARELGEQTVIDFRKTSFKHWLSIAQGKTSVVTVAEQWQSLPMKEMERLLLWMIGWVMDNIKLSYGGQHNLVNIDLVTDLQEYADKLDLQELYKFYDFLLLSRQRLETQLNKQLLFEDILIQWQAVNGR